MSDAAKIPEWRKSAYKNRGSMQADDLRRRREEASVEIRKSKREESLAKRRNLNLPAGGEPDSEDEDEQQLAGSSSTFSLAQGQLAEELPAMVAGVFTENQEEQVSNTIKFRKLLSKGNVEGVRLCVRARVRACAYMYKYILYCIRIMTHSPLSLFTRTQSADSRGDCMRCRTALRAIPSFAKCRVAGMARVVV